MRGLCNSCESSNVPLTLNKQGVPECGNCKRIAQNIAHHGSKMDFVGCNRCQHGKNDHRDDICYGNRFCGCCKFEEVIKKLPPKKKIKFTGVRKKDGWDYKKSFGGTQSEMINLYVLNGKTDNEIQELLHCKKSSIRGRKSELRAVGLIP